MITIYIYKLCVFCYCNIVATHAHIAAHWSHWFRIHIIFPSCFYLIFVTRNSLLKLSIKKPKQLSNSNTGAFL